jgi:hypothetical protein
MITMLHSSINNKEPKESFVEVLDIMNRNYSQYNMTGLYYNDNIFLHQEVINEKGN